MSTYEPGTVAEIRWRMTSGAERALFNGESWCTESGVFVGTPTDIRPLVVLDLDRFVTPELLVTWLPDHPICGSYSVAAEIADQIEAQTKPPKPVEPHGWGAVVETADLRYWMLTNPAHGIWTDASNAHAEYADINAVRVLSEGVTA